MSLQQNNLFSDDLDRGLLALEGAAGSAKKMLDRFKAEVGFAGRLAAAHPDVQAEWEALILQAVASVNEAMGNGVTAAEAVKAGEAMLAPLGVAAKQYTLHCVGHAHIDMDWQWNWPETVATVNDTFTTVDALMSEFPTFRFSQSQTSVYAIMQEYLPELFQRVKQRVKEGRWEITANMWVEGSKNMACGEILCRHMLYTKRFFKQEFGLEYDAIKVDYEPDTFGHAHTTPTILNTAGVKRYYFCRTGPGPQLFWWQGKDGARVLTFDDRKQWYLGPLTPEVTKHIFEFEQATGLKDYLFTYGVGDHGGGPTRKDLRSGVEMDGWPIFPNVKFSTTDAFFAIAEQQAKDLPVVDAEMNFIFEGCYTSQSNIKRANRKSENLLIEAEWAALLGKGLTGMRYPAENLFTGWKHAMFNQFHDILPGSGIHATYEYSQGLFQEVIAQTSMVKTRALRAIAGKVNTACTCPCTEQPAWEPETNVGPGIGGGPGEAASDGAVSKRGAGAVCCDPFVVFNPNPWPRTETIVARVWNREWETEKIVVKDDEGNTFPGQVLAKTPGWGYDYIDVAFPVKDVAGFGYRSYSVARVATPGTAEGPVTADGMGTIENEFYKVQVEGGSGAIIHLIDKRTGVDLVPAGERLGVIEYILEAPHGMSSWTIGAPVKTQALVEGATMEFPQKGPFLATVKANHKLGDSKLTLTVSVAAGVPRVDFTLEADWLERGTPEKGVPMLKAAFPLAVQDGVATYEVANGFVSRSTNPEEIHSFTSEFAPGASVAEVPALKWADLTGTQDGVTQPVGATLVNDTKYGHSTKGNTLRLTLLRSSYDPDPLPELGKHTIRYALHPHIGAWTASDATRAGAAFNLPFNIVSTSQQIGTLPARNGFAELLTSNIMLSGIKKAEDSDALIVRLYEIEGKATTAQVQLDSTLAPANAPAVETDTLEVPKATNTAKMQDGVLSVEVPAFGIVTVKIG